MSWKIIYYTITESQISTYSDIYCETHFPRKDEIFVQRQCKFKLLLRENKNNDNYIYIIKVREIAKNILPFFSPISSTFLQ